MNAADGRSMPVTTGDPTTPKISAPSNFRPNWLPDSARIAFLNNDAGRTTLQVADLTSRRPEPLMDLGPLGPADDARRSAINPALDFRLSPDTKRIAFSEMDRATGLSRIYVRGIGEAQARPLGAGDQAESYPIWSPDGRWIASEVRSDRGAQVGVRSADGGPLRVLTSQPGEAWVHHWTGDSKRIVFAGQRAGVWNVWWVSRETGEETQVTRYTGVNTFVRYPTSSPSGDRIVFELGEVRGNIWLATLPAGGKTERWALHRLAE